MAPRTWRFATRHTAITYLANLARPFEDAEFPTVDTICEMWVLVKIAMNEQEARLASLGLQDALRDANYFTYLADRYRLWKLTANIATSIGAVIAGTFAGLSIYSSTLSIPIIGLCVGLVTGGISIFSSVLDFSGRSVRATERATQSALLASSWRTVLLKYSYNEDERHVVEDLQRKQKEIEAAVSGELPNIPKLIKKAEEGAHTRVIHELYGDLSNGQQRERAVEAVTE